LPGSSSGKTGSAAVQTAGVSFPVRVNVTDVRWNVITSSSPAVTVTTTDLFDSPDPKNITLVSGTSNFYLTLVTAATTQLTASGSGLNSQTSPVITVVPGAAAKLQLLVPGRRR